uniref:Homologous recombination OB-fold protein OB-fold domain-containing protein n=1 Tax=Tanacetum cinerariifolium TaxID=118510 RepID=A0A699IDD3_TANCI|nr:hypothetical protein [Tanacetum cinerariifolium]
MAYLVPHTDNEIQALVQKLIDEDMVRQKAITDLALQFDYVCTARNDLRKAYEKCGSSSQTHEIGDVYLTEKKLHQLHLHEEALKVTLEEEARDEKERKEKIRQKQDWAVMSTQEYRKKVVEGVGEDEDFKSGLWFCVTDYVNANGGTVSGCLGDIKNFQNNGKLDQVVAIVKSCSLNMIVDLTVTMKDLSGTITGTIYHKVIVRNVVKVFRKDTVPESDSG